MLFPKISSLHFALLSSYFLGSLSVGYSQTFRRSLPASVGATAAEQAGDATYLSTGDQLSTLPVLTNTTTAAKAAGKPLFPETGVRLSSLPAPNGIVTIAKGANVYIDASIARKKISIASGGKLRCSASTPNDVELRVESIEINGIFECGTTESPYLKQLKIKLTSTGSIPSDLGSTTDFRSIVVGAGGSLQLFGDTKNSGWGRIIGDVIPGNNFAVLPAGSFYDAILNSWSVGDPIVIAPTSYRPDESEEFVIKSINRDMRRIYLGKQTNANGPIYTAQFTYFHSGTRADYQGTRNGRVSLNMAAEIANLRRNILIYGDSDLSARQIGGHLYNHGGNIQLSGVELTQMGQAGTKARYPVHWHHVGNADGQFIQYSSIHHSFQRCVVIHQTQNVRVTGNVCYNFRGHGFFLEDGNETGNTLESNLAIYARAPDDDKAILQSDKLTFGSGENADRFPGVSSFWISNPQNTIRNNTAAGSEGTGFWNSFCRQDCVAGIESAQNKNTTAFENNTAHSNAVGFTWDGVPGGELTGNKNNPDDRRLIQLRYEPPAPPQIKGLVVYRNALTGIYTRARTMVFDKILSADNGIHHFHAYNAVVQNSWIIGRSTQFKPSDQDSKAWVLNTIQKHAIAENKPYNYPEGRWFREAGVAIYDGPIELKSIDFMGFFKEIQEYSAPKELEYLNCAKGNCNIQSSPFLLIGASERVTGSSEKLSFDPEPFLRISTTIYPSDLSFLDKDGSLSGTQDGRFLVGPGSSGIGPRDHCLQSAEGLTHRYVDSGNLRSQYGYPIELCSLPFKQTLLHMPNGSDVLIHIPNQQAETSYGRIIPLANTSEVVFEVFASPPSSSDPIILKTISSDASPTIPIIKMSGVGSSCKMSTIPSYETWYPTAPPSVWLPTKESLTALMQSSVAATHTDASGNFYLRLIPNNYFGGVTVNPFNTFGLARPKAGHFVLQCDPKPKPTGNVIGQITEVQFDSTTDQFAVRGWGCVRKQGEGPPVKVELELRVGDPATDVSTFKLVSNLPEWRGSEPRARIECNQNMSSFEFRVPAPSYLGKAIAIRAVNSGNYLENSGRFQFHSRAAFPLKARHSQKFLKPTSYAQGASVVQVSVTGNSPQWVLKDPVLWSRIQSAETFWCMGTKVAPDGNTDIVLVSCDTAPRWRLEPVSGGFRTIRMRDPWFESASDNCVHVQGGSKADNARVILNTCGPGWSNQEF